MPQDFAFSWYITLVFQFKFLFSGTDVPKITRFVVHHFWGRNFTFWEGVFPA